MIRFYPDGPIAQSSGFGGFSSIMGGLGGFGASPSSNEPSYYLTDKGLIYAVKQSGYEQEVGAFFSPTLNRWIKGKLTGYSLSALTRNYLATMDTKEEAVLIGEGVTGLKPGTEEFRMKMFLLADEVVEKPEEPEEDDLPTTGSKALARAMAQSRGPQVRSVPSLGMTSTTYLDDLVRYHGGDKADWVEVSRSTKQTQRGVYDFIVLRNDIERKDVLAKVDSRTGDLDNEAILGAVSFGVYDYDGTITVTFGFTPQGGDREIPDQDTDWVFSEHYGIDLSSMFDESCENYFECHTGADEATVKAFLEGLGFVHDPSIDL